MTEATKWLSGVDALLGAWLVVSPFVLAEPAGALSGGDWNNVIIGIAVFLVAGYNYYRQAQTMPASVGSAALVALLGLWMVVSPIVVFPLDAAMFWSNVVTGTLVTIVAVYVAYEGRGAEMAAPETA